MYFYAHQKTKKLNKKKKRSNHDREIRIDARAHTPQDDFNYMQPAK
jgi:hypothetical protein